MTRGDIMLDILITFLYGVMGLSLIFLYVFLIILFGLISYMFGCYLYYSVQFFYNKLEITLMRIVYIILGLTFIYMVGIILQEERLLMQLLINFIGFNGG